MAARTTTDSAKRLDDAFGFFTEIGIIQQLSRALLEVELSAGLKMIHFSVLNNLWRLGDGKLPSDLAQTFQVPRSHMTDVLAKLEKLRLVRFEPNATDGRSKIVRITEKGAIERKKVIFNSRKALKDLGGRYDLNRLSKMRIELAELREIMDDMRSE